MPSKPKYRDKLKILHITSELTPIAKAGGLGDVVGYLPKVMAKEFHLEIRIMMPKYKCIDLNKYPAERIISDLKIPFLGKDEKISVWKTFLPETIIPVYLIENNKFFPGNGIYDQKINGYPGGSAYVFLSVAALELLKVFDWCPAVIHLHDAMMGMVAKWLKTSYANDRFYKKIASILTIHNLKNQMRIPNQDIRLLGLKKGNFKKMKNFLKKNKEVNIMAEAIDSADMVNTVSPTYANEVLTKKYGSGLSNLLKKEKSKFTGILNGMDYAYFDPRKNPDTPVKYWIDSLDKKVENKLYLQQKLGLVISPDLPLICVVSRLVNQKGLDLVDDVLDDLVDMGAQFVILGSGQKSIEKVFVKAEKEHPKEIAAEIGFDANFAQTIYAGADMFLMPSRFEPCGLSQIIAMRFGTIPIVRKTGGLADTVRDDYTGFVFKDYDKDTFLQTLRRAVDVYYNQKDFWRKMQIRAMKKDFSWKASAKKYIWLYKKAVSNHRKYLEGKEEVK